MFIQFLGTSAGCPTLIRNVSSISFVVENPIYEVWLFDCGEGTQHQILKTNLKITKISKIFITHLHGDHVFGLPGLLTTISMCKSFKKIEIYGPKGVKFFLNNLFKVTNSSILFPIYIYEINEGRIFLNDYFDVKCYLLNHNIDSYCYFIKQLDRKGSINVKKLIKLGILPGPIYKKIKLFESFFLEDGRKIICKDFINNKIIGKKIFIFGDTSPIKNIINDMYDIDLLIYESTLDDFYRKKANSRGHSTNIQASLIAKNYCVKKLIITHFSTRYNSRDLKKILKNSRKIFSQTYLASDLYIFRI